MRFLSALLYGSALLQNIAATDPHSGAGDIVKELGPRLSKGASISLPSSPEWDDLQVRASTPRIHPGYLAAVQVATEKDVQETVCIIAHLLLFEKGLANVCDRSNMPTDTTSPFSPSLVPTGGRPP